MGKSVPAQSEIRIRATVAPSRAVRPPGDDFADATEVATEVMAGPEAADAETGVAATVADGNGDASDKPKKRAPRVQAGSENQGTRSAAVSADEPASFDERDRQRTIAMPIAEVVGAPPEMPKPRNLKLTEPPRGTVEDPTHMPHPFDIPEGQPSDAALPPGLVPRGDSRSLRRGDAFALVYRLSTYVVTRAGLVGQRGAWRVVEYPTSAAASTAYARECSKFVDDGYSDYRG